MQTKQEPSLHFTQLDAVLAHVHAYVDELERRRDAAREWYNRAHGSAHSHDLTPKGVDHHDTHNVDPPPSRLSNDAADSRYRLDGHIARARAAGRQCVSVDSESGESINEALGASRHRKEAAHIQLPTRIPTSCNVNEWRN